MAATKKKTAAKLKRGATRKPAPRKPGGKDKKSAKGRLVPLLTPFMHEFKAQFVGTSVTPVWPTKGQSKDSAFKEMGQVLSILFEAAEYGKLPTRDGSTSIPDRLGDIFANTGWPGDAPIPKRLKKIAATARRYEIAVAADVMLEAINNAECKKDDDSPKQPDVVASSMHSAMKKKSKGKSHDDCTEDCEEWPPMMLFGWPGHD
jgi:hypothetical protein